MREVMNQVTIKVKVRLQHQREMEWRAWLGMRLIFLAACVMGCRIEVEPFTSIEPNVITCPVCNGMPVQIDRFDHSKVHECTFCKGKGKISIG